MQFTFKKTIRLKKMYEKSKKTFGPFGVCNTILYSCFKLSTILFIAEGE